MKYSDDGTYIPRKGKGRYRTCLDRSQVSTTCDCPGTYGIAPYPFWVCRFHHRNISSATNLQFRFDSSDSSCVNSRPMFLLKTRQDISGIHGSLLWTIDFNRWYYFSNISHRGSINSPPCECWILQNPILNRILCHLYWIWILDIFKFVPCSTAILPFGCIITIL